MNVRKQYEDLCMDQVRVARKIAKLQTNCGAHDKLACPYFGSVSDWSKPTCSVCFKTWTLEEIA